MLPENAREMIERFIESDFLLKCSSFKVYALRSLQNSVTFSNFSLKCNAEVGFNIIRT